MSQAPDGSEAFLRHLIDGDSMNCAHFVPTDLTDAQMTETVQKRSTLGACFNGHINSLPNTHAKVMWECEEVDQPPAHLRPTKPKLWLLGCLELDEGFFYQLS